MARGNQYRDPIERALRMRNSKPKIQAASTMKWQGLYEKTKRDIEEREEKKAQENKAEEDRIFKQQKVFFSFVFLLI